MNDIELTDLARRHHLNPHDFGCSCSQWTYRAKNPLYGIDFEGHLIHVVEVTAAQVREQIAAEIAEILPGVLAATVRDDCGWLSDAQEAVSRSGFIAGGIGFCGEGSIDIRQVGEYAARIVRGES